MALSKKIELENGVIVNYHRIVSITKITNNQVIIEIGSYTSENKRQEEIDYYEGNNEVPMNVFIETTYINIEYDEDKNIEDYYSYLKTTDLFKNAKDI